MDRFAKTQSQAQVESLGAILSHTLRRRIWDSISERPVSPRELADELKVPVNDVAYHVRVLRGLGVIELAGTRPVRGATQHFYRAVRRPHLTDDEVAAMSREDSLANAVQVFRFQFADAAGSIEAEKLVERPEHYLFRLPANLDEEGWQEFHTIFAEAAERLYQAEARCVERRSKTEEESESVSVVAHLNLFERG
ncbi:MAG: winged helix-turn-helix transcriptional regulator [Actinobacteria bacterium]|nr:winged helix-turn-helix transcriptional regulator [Actinomycetota bacterium]